MYHIVKQSRIYSGYPYCGYSSNYKPLEYEDLEVAINKAKEMNTINPVGWNVFYSNTGECVFGHDFFA